MVRARPFNHTGPGQAQGFVLPSFARQAVEIALGRREPVVRVGNLESVRDFLDVEMIYNPLVQPFEPAGDQRDALCGRTSPRIGLCERPAPRCQVDKWPARPVLLGR